MVILAPQLGGPGLECRWRRRLYRSTLVVAAAITASWMLCQYAFQVSHLCFLTIGIRPALGLCNSSAISHQARQAYFSKTAKIWFCQLTGVVHFHSSTMMVTQRPCTYALITRTLHNVQVAWLRHFLGLRVVEMLSWGGLRALPPSAGSLERVLRVKILVLVAFAFERRASRCVQSKFNVFLLAGASTLKGWHILNACSWSFRNCWDGDAREGGIL